MRLVVAAALALALSFMSTPAEARRHCARGQIYRVSLGTCQARAAFRHVAKAEKPRRARTRRRPVQAEPEALVPISLAQECRPVQAMPQEPAPWLWPGPWVYNAGLAHPGKWNLQ